MFAAIASRTQGTIALFATAALALLTSCHMNPGTDQPALPASTTTAQGNGSTGGEAAMSGSAPAQAATQPEELVPLKNRLGFRGTYTNEGEDDPWTRDGLDLEVDFGHRMGPNLEVGGILGMITSDWDELLDPDLYYLGASGRFYFSDKGQVQPWLGASLGLGEGVYGDDHFNFYRVGVGASYFASTSVALEGSLAYTGRSTDSVIDAEDEISDMTLRIGISWFF